MNGARFKSKKFIPLAGAIVCACAFALWAFLAVLPATASATAPSTTLSPQANDLATTSLTTQADSNTNWGLESIYATEAQQVTKGDGVYVAILDTGFYDHPDFSNNVKERWNAAALQPSSKGEAESANFLTQLKANSNVEPPAALKDTSESSMGNPNHGTHVAGIVHQVAPEANIILIRVSDDNGGIPTWALYNAFALLRDYQSKNNNVCVVNFSGGTALNNMSSIDNPADANSWAHGVYDQIDAAYDSGIVTVCSAGNEYAKYKQPYENYPSDYSKAVSVMALAKRGSDPFEVQLDSASNRNAANATAGQATKDICAPGKKIYSSTGTNGHGMLSGTSMAAPHVAGVLALMFASNTELQGKDSQSADRAVDLLYSSATPLASSATDKTYGCGEVNAAAAVGARAIKGIVELPVGYETEYSIIHADSSENWSWNISGNNAEITKSTKTTCTVKGLKKGDSTTLTATYNGKTLTKAIKVTPISFAYIGTEGNPAPKDYPVKDVMALKYKTTTYTGSALRPRDMVVTLGGKELVEGKDYSVSIDSRRNVNVGTKTAVVTLTGLGDYSDSKTFYFDIVKASIQDAKIAVSPESMTYTGGQLKPAVAITYNGKTLAAGTDYELQYLNNVSVGTGQVKIKGLGNFIGGATKNFTITSANAGSKAKDPATVSVLKKAIKIKYKKVKKKKQTVACPVAVSNAHGAVSYKIKSVNKKAGKKKIAINAKTGKITVNKGCKKGTYKVKIQVDIAQSRSYDAATHVIPITIRVK